MTHGSNRFSYQAPGLLRSTWLGMTGQNVEAWIEDHTTGERVVLNEHDNALLTALGERIHANNVTDAGKIDAAFERVARAIHDAQRGDLADYSLLFTWQDSDWDEWIDAIGKRIPGVEPEQLLP